MACVRAEKSKRRLKYGLEIILDDLDFTWTPAEIQRAIDMWNEGCSIRKIARELRRYDLIDNATDEVGLLIMHLRRQKKIQVREGGLIGTR